MQRPTWLPSDGTVKVIPGFIDGYLWWKRIASKFKSQQQKWEHSLCCTSAVFGASMVTLSSCGTSVFDWLLYSWTLKTLNLCCTVQNKISHSLSLSKYDTVWHINVPKCRREVQIIARLETPPFLLVCRSKHAETGTRSRGVASRLVNWETELECGTSDFNGVYERENIKLVLSNIKQFQTTNILAALLKLSAV